MELTREIHNFATEAEWLGARRGFITSTEAAGLFNAGAYEGSRTFYELFCRKSGLISERAFVETDRIKWGRRLESAIAYGIAEDYGVTVEPFKSFITIPSLRIASSFDFKVVGLAENFEGDQLLRDLFKEHGPGILEIKNVDGIQFKKTWIDGDDEVEAPVHIEMQAQMQMEVADMNWAIIAPLVGGNTPKIVYRLRDIEAGAAIREKAAELWLCVAAGNPPPPDYTKDGDTIARLYVNNDGSEIDLSENSRLIALCAEHSAAGVAEKSAKSRKDAAKAEILTIIESAKTVHAGAFKISAGTNKEVFKAFDRAESVRYTITRSVVPGGHVESTTPAYRNVRLYAAK